MNMSAQTESSPKLSHTHTQLHKHTGDTCEVKIKQTIRKLEKGEEEQIKFGRLRSAFRRAHIQFVSVDYKNYEVCFFVGVFTFNHFSS